MNALNQACVDAQLLTVFSRVRQATLTMNFMKGIMKFVINND